MSAKLMNYLTIGADNFEVADAAARAGIGSPLVAATAAAMTDTSKIYVYTGSETGYTAGNWYYYNGSAWADGGIYNSAAINIDTTLTVAGAAADAKAVGDRFTEVDSELDDKANIDGLYENMTVGNAEQIVSTVGEENKTPYNFRTSGGTIDIGDREVDMLVGGTVAWNQLVPDNKIHLSETVESDVASTGWGSASASLGNTFANHVVLAVCNISNSKCFPAWMNVNQKFVDISNGSTEQTKSACVYKPTSSQTGGIKIRLIAGLTAGTYTADIQLFDLTQMFGSTIADYIYTLETTTAGAGVAWFRNLFPKPYYAYNAGQLMSVKTSSHNMTGFNAYDNGTGTAKLLGGMEYQITGTYTALSYSTGETITPDANGKFTPSANGLLTVTGGNGTDTCVHLVWDGERDGEYEEFKANTYPLDPDLELRGVPKLDASNNLYYDGDTYESDGTVTRKYGIVDLGSLSYIYTGNDPTPHFNSTTAPTGIKLPSTYSTKINLVCLGYDVSKTWSQAFGASGNNMNVAVAASNGIIGISNSAYTDPTTFKTAMSGVYLVYELATPTTETADTFTNPQIVDDFGTEEYVDNRDVQIPVGHDTMYQANLRAKLEMSPNLPESNGDYLLHYNDGEATYTAHTSPIPALPSEDGTYVLTCTVTDGTATLTWGAQT